MSKISTAIMTFMWKIIGILLAAATLIVGIQIFMRYVISHPLTWVDITSTILFVLMLQFAIPVMFYKKTYLAFTLIEEHLHGTIKEIVEVFINLAILIFTLSVLYGATELILNTSFARKVPGASRIPIVFVYFSMVISMFCSSIIAIDHIKVSLKKDGNEGKEAIKC